ncbi:MAG: BadF/BadG/BcrA/BcrD ATPase family protein [Candidatus Delongbacteria bacterium]|jgi:N-acetylglucosamine kinase-like BadF-type ATPase|nr:BadF/BadG/BcrA/BcrD ATPase family protein [Candidatus Delongbacteria bacterium]
MTDLPSGQENKAYGPSVLYAGIDGGGTKTNISILDKDGRIVFSGSYGPSNLLNGDEFEDNVLIMFRDAFLNLKDRLRIKTAIHITAGFAGTSSDDYETRFRNVFKKAALGYDISIDHLNINSDALLALNVYFTDKPGLLLISGTGSICYGKDQKGDLFRTGGFGYLIDDAGSGFWFGKEAVKAALRSHYHYGQVSILEDMVREHFGVQNTEDIFDIIYKGDPRSVISSASELVFSAAENGCKVAGEIVESGAAELIGLVRNCSEHIGRKAPFVVLHGSVFRQEKLVGLIKKDLIDDMNIYISDKRIDLEAANSMLDQNDL